MRYPLGVPAGIARRVIEQAAIEGDTNTRELLSRCRCGNVVQARKAVVHKLHNEMGYSLGSVARALNRDRATVRFHAKLEESRRGGLGRTPMEAKHGPFTT